MPAVVVSQVRVHPGKDPAYIALCQEYKPLAAKHGLSSRLFQALLAGPNAGVYSFVSEAADLATLAAGLQALFADPAWPDLQQRFLGPEGVCTLLSFGQASEVPL
jgi:hypothetical protein